MENINHSNYPHKGDFILYKKEPDGFFRKKEKKS